MNSFYNLARQRRSCRRFKDDKISEKDIQTLTEIALMSPSSKRNNPWHFIVVDKPSLLKHLSMCKEHGSTLIAGAPLAIVVAADPEKSDVWTEDSSIASIYLQLAAEDLGLGSCWVQVRERMHKPTVKSEDFVKHLLEIPDRFRVESIIAIGYKSQESTPFNKEDLLKGRIYKNKFSNH